MFKKTCQNWTKNEPYNTQKYNNTNFSPFGPLFFKRMRANPPFSMRLYFVVRMIVLQFHGNQSYPTKVIARKHIKNTISSPFGRLVSKQVGVGPQFAIRGLVAEIILLKLHGNRSTGIN